MLEVVDATVILGGTRALDGATVDVGQEIVGVLGPSGSGKSTLLRAIAGLVELDGGSVRFDGADLADVPAHRRRFGLMFQDYALFPHLDVRGNVGFGLRMQGVDESARRDRIDEVLDLVGLGSFADREVEHLSGGEAQRVALARALAPRPRLLMLDEPLGALDRLLRERLVREIRDILDSSRTPAIYVTHDHDEAAAVADRIAILRAGRVVQDGTMEELRGSPADDWVAEFVQG